MEFGKEQGRLFGKEQGHLFGKEQGRFFVKERGRLFGKEQGRLFCFATQKCSPRSRAAFVLGDSFLAHPNQEFWAFGLRMDNF